MPTPLPRGRLILNGHRIHTIDQLETYMTRRLGSKASLSLHDIDTIITDYHIQEITIRHADTFLLDEPQKEKYRALSLLAPYMKK
ncbi:MAG: hypothetical protein H6766_07645 [Candidatus Peribacteria bacterium]|nr:MAG: hypothetical protein H6766_07645 [Candidatus Peribacteria bacterium]